MGIQTWSMENRTKVFHEEINKIFLSYRNWYGEFDTTTLHLHILCLLTRLASIS